LAPSWFSSYSRLRVPALTVSGLVVDPSGAPVQGARVTLTLGGAPELGAASRTNRRGLYKVSIPRERIQPVAGALQGAVSIEASDFEPVRFDVKWVEAAELDVGAVLLPSGSPPLSPDPQTVNFRLEGTVRDSAGRPVPDAQLSFVGGSVSRPRALITDEAGHFETLLLQSPRTFTLEITKPGHETTRFTMAVDGIAQPQSLARGTWDLVLPAVGAAPPTEQRRLTSVRPGDWSSRYRRGVEALESQDWAGAVGELLVAIQARPRSGGEVSLRDGRTGAYLPYLQLGIAYLNLGRHEEAIQAFETEEQYEVVTASRRDLENLRTFRRFAEQARQSDQAKSDQVLAAAVQRSLEESAALERQGRFEPALTALDPAIAVAPQEAAVAKARDRLRGILDQEEERRAVESRIARLTSEGRSHADAGRFEEAAASFRQALDLRPSAELERLLGEARAKLAEEITAGETTAAEITESLVEVRNLADRGLFDPALARLETVLSMSPNLSTALELQRQLLLDREEQVREEHTASSVADLMAEGTALLDAGEIRQALAIFNRVIALDGENEDAAHFLQEAYTKLSQSVLGGSVGVTRLAPVLVVTNPASSANPSGVDNAPQERVSSSEFVLTALILDDQPNLVVACCSDEARPEAGSLRVGDQDTVRPLKGEKVLEHATQVGADRSLVSLYRFTYSVPVELAPGHREFHIVVMDSDELFAEASHRVLYVRPLLRSPWFYSGVAMLIPLGLVAGHGFRVRRRNRLLKRRFNPYVAGAPVLDDDLFVGRESLISRILETIHNNSVLVYGERRIGKTSLLHHLKRRLEALQDPAYKFFPVFIDLEGTSQEDFFATIAADVFEALQPHLGGSTASPLTDASRYGYHELVRDLGRVVRTLAETTDKKVKLVLLIDEVDQLNSYDPRVNQSLRKLFMKSFAENLVAVMSGVSIKRHWSTEGSPWYNFFEEIEIGSLDDHHAERLVRAPVKGVFSLEQPVVERILELSERKPYAIQKMCAALVNRSHEVGSRRITVEDVDSLATTASI
jgi:tetratricopeptide (TPR) repeat protein